MAKVSASDSITGHLLHSATKSKFEIGADGTSGLARISTYLSHVIEDYVPVVGRQGDENASGFV